MTPKLFLRSKNSDGYGEAVEPDIKVMGWKMGAYLASLPVHSLVHPSYAEKIGIGNWFDDYKESCQIRPANSIGMFQNCNIKFKSADPAKWQTRIVLIRSNTKTPSTMKYTVSTDKSTAKAIASMEKPQDSAEYYSGLDFAGEQRADEALARYNEHLASLPEITLSPSLSALVEGGQVIERGVHFVEQWQEHTESGWVNCGKEKWTHPLTHRCRILAIPLPATDRGGEEDLTISGFARKCWPLIYDNYRRHQEKPSPDWECNESAKQLYELAKVAMDTPTPSSPSEDAGERAKVMPHENRHNLDVAHLGCCTECGGNSFIPAAALTASQGDKGVEFLKWVRKDLDVHIYWDKRERPCEYKGKYYSESELYEVFINLNK